MKRFSILLIVLLPFCACNPCPDTELPCLPEYPGQYVPECGKGVARALVARH
jgi:hypothetical protein